MRDFDPGAGGILDLETLSADEEAHHKVTFVRRALEARGLAVPPLELFPSPRREGARARIRLRVAPGGELVMHRPGTHERVRPPLTRMARPEVVTAALAVERFLAQSARLAGLLLSVELRSDGSRVLVVLEASPGREPLARREALALGEALPPGSGLAIGARAVLGDPWVEIRIGGLPLRFGPLTFYQVNLEANERLVDEVGAHLRRLAPARLLDLFGGAGNLSLPAAAGGLPTTLVEMHPSAVRDARENVRRLGLDVEVLERDARSFRAGERFFDVALLDPPRAGAGPLMESLVLTRPRAIVLVSCHAPSLARDLSVAVKAGYTLTSLRLHDLFPLTSHVEAVALLERA